MAPQGEQHKEQQQFLLGHLSAEVESLTKWCGKKEADIKSLREFYTALEIKMAVLGDLKEFKKEHDGMLTWQNKAAAYISILVYFGSKIVDRVGSLIAEAIGL